MNNLLNFLKKTQSDKQLKDFDEAAIKQAVVLKILSLLEWDPFDLDEIHPEYKLKGMKIDFALKHKKLPKAFISVKKDTSNFKKDIETLLGWSVQGNVKLSLFTNGPVWWFFLPLLEGSINDKMFCTIDIQRENIDVIVKKFSNFLLKENVISDKTIKLAEDICNKRKQAMLINEYLPKAWEKIMDEPDRWLVDVISGLTEDLCGYKPDKEKVKEFIVTKVKIKAESSDILESSSPKKVSKKDEKDYKGILVKSFNFRGKQYDVKSWQEIPWKICDIVYEKHKDSFESILFITLNGREYFSKNEYRFLMSKKISNTEVYINYDLSETVSLSLSKEILLNFGYKENDLVINTQ